jgi:hypothetical protein
VQGCRSWLEKIVSLLAQALETLLSTVAFFSLLANKPQGEGDFDRFWRRSVRHISFDAVAKASNHIVRPNTRFAIGRSKFAITNNTTVCSQMFQLVQLRGPWGHLPTC